MHPQAIDTLTQATVYINDIRHQIQAALIGQDQVVDQVLISLFSAGHVLIEGVPGLGKTLLVRALAKTFGGQFARIQFTPDLMPSDVVGHAMFDLQSEQFHIRKGPIFTQLLLADEINRAPAKTQAALLEVMQEFQVTIEGKAYPLTLPFMTLATQNPIEQEGTYPLPEAELDRFLLKVRIDYPSHEQECQMVQMVTSGSSGDKLDVSAVSTIISAENVLQIQKLTAQIRLDISVVDYAVNIARATRNWSGISTGAGPRGGISLIRAARGVALLDGRDYVTPDDIKWVALPALRHRISLAPELELEGAQTDDMLRNILEQTQAPRQ